MWVRIPVVTLVSLSKTLNHNCFVLRMGRKAVVPVCCVMHVKEPRTLIVKEKGLAPVFLDWQLNAPKLFAPRNRFHLDRWSIINALLHLHLHFYFIFFLYKEQMWTIAQQTLTSQWTEWYRVKLETLKKSSDGPIKWFTAAQSCLTERKWAEEKKEERQTSGQGKMSKV